MELALPRLAADGRLIAALTVGLLSVYMKARSAPRSEPANSQDFLPRAKPRSARSAALLVRQIRPSSRKRVNAGQRLSM
jgi:hypothetical protein